MRYECTDELTAGPVDAPPAPTVPARASAEQRTQARWLAIAFAGTALVSGAVSAHLVSSLRDLHFSAAHAVWIASSIGVMQVLGRALELSFGGHLVGHTLGTITFARMFMSLLLLLACDVVPVAVLPFAVLYGAANGVMTILEGQNKGHPGEENRLSFEEFPYLSLVKTYSVNQQTSDSAPTMTAMVTGVKTKDGILSIDEDVVHSDQSTAAGNELTTILEMAEEEGLSTGIVSTARVTHATPAACYAHSVNRDWESDAETPAGALGLGAKDIARQLLESPFGDGPEVVLGGGRSYFTPNTANDPEDVGTKGRRKDGRDLTAEWSARPRSPYVWNKAAFDAVNPRSTDHLLGLFERSHMEYEADRLKDTAGEPSLAEMTSKAIDILSRNRKGFFLMVEAGRIDHAHHAGNATRALQDTIALSNAVRAALAKTSERDTLVLATADHSHVFTIAGYPARGNDILGKVVTLDEQGEPGEGYATDANGHPYTTLGYANGPGYRVGGRPDLTDVDTTDLEFLQEATVPMGSETHAGEDVALFARGPSAHLVHGNQEQTISFYVMARALGLDGRSRDWFSWF